MSEKTVPTSWGRGHARRIAGAAIVAIVASTLASGALTPAYAATAGVGPVDVDNGFPTWYSDGTNQLELCLSGLQCIGAPPNPDAPVSFPDNFPDEAFWFIAEAGDADNPQMYRAALESSFANDSVVAGDQIGFARLRFRIDGLKKPDPAAVTATNPTGATSYRITHPYGIKVIEAADGGLAGGTINETFDEGVCAPTATTPCDWAGVGAAFLGDFKTNTTPFLVQTNRVAGFIGDILSPGTVTGGPNGNAVIVEELSPAGLPVNTVANVTEFTVQGKISTAVAGAPTTPNLAALSDTGRSNTDNITSDTTPTLTGNAPTGSNVELLVDGGATPVAASTQASGAYSATLTALPPGSHTVQARTAGLTSGTLTFTVDTTAPTVSITAPFPSNPSANPTPTLNFISNDPDATFECRLMPSNPAIAPCDSGLTYDAQVKGTYTFNVWATDAAGNVSGPRILTWRIGEAVPIVTTRSPATNTSNVLLAADATATFSKPVTGVGGTTFTLKRTSTGQAIAASVTYNPATRVAKLNPTAELGGGTQYTATLTSGIRDADGNALATHSWKFVSGLRPTVTTRSPAANGTGVVRSTNVAATFSESVGYTGTATFTLKRTSTGAAIGGAVSYNPATKVLTRNPSATLLPNTKYTAILSNLIRDANGNRLTATSWSFTTGR